MKNKINIGFRKNGHKITDAKLVKGVLEYKIIDEMHPIVLLPKAIVISEINKIIYLNITDINGGAFKYYLLGFLWSQFGKKGLPYYHKVFKSYPSYDENTVTKEFQNTRRLISNHISAEFIRLLNVEVARVMHDLKIKKR